MGERETKKTFAGKIAPDRTREQEKQRSIFPASRSEAAQQFSQRKIFVVHTTTAILKCNLQVLSNTFESVIA
jgi:hypothetical protein